MLALAAVVFVCYFDSPKIVYSPYQITLEKGVLRAESLAGKQYFSGPVSMEGNQNYWTYTTLWAGDIFQLRHYPGEYAYDGEVKINNGAWIPCTRDRPDKQIY